MSKKITLEGLDHFKDKENAMIAGKPESTNTATVAHAVGEYFYWKGVLHIVTAAIAVGGTIQTNTNVKPAVLADDVSDLKESFNNIETEVAASFEQKTITDVSIASFDDGADDVPVKKLVVDIEPVQSGTGDPSPDNIRPITGLTGAKVNRTSVNIWDETWEVGSYRTDNGAKYVDNSRIRSANYISVKPNTEYWIVASNNLKICLYDINKTFVRTIAALSNSSFLTDENVFYITITNVVTDYGTVYKNNWSINYPSSDHNYHNGKNNKTYDITFPSEAGTVYGGKLEINEDGSGTLTVDEVSQTVGTMTVDSFYNNGEGKGSSCAFGLTQSAPSGVTSNILQAKSNMLSTAGARYFGANRAEAVGQGIQYAFNGSGSHIRIYDESATITQAEFINKYSNCQFVYPLATPIIYNLTATQITTLLSTNNIWADTGDISELTYRVMNDTSAQITLVKAIIAPVIGSMIADTALAVNDFRIVDNILYRVTTPIASGGTLTVGTNVVATTVADVLKSLLN